MEELLLDKGVLLVDDELLGEENVESDADAVVVDIIDKVEPELKLEEMIVLETATTRAPQIKSLFLEVSAMLFK